MDEAAGRARRADATSDLPAGRGGREFDAYVWAAMPMQAGHYHYALVLRDGDGVPLARTRTESFSVVGGAAFARTLRLEISHSGPGKVLSFPEGIDCGRTCTANFPFGAVIRLVAQPAAGAVFAGWSGGGCGRVTTCRIRVGPTTAVAATFVRAPGASVG